MKETAAGPLGTELFQKEQDDLLSDLNNIPKKACDRRVRSITVCSTVFNIFYLQQARLS
jgi:hypothetical protein